MEDSPGIPDEGARQSVTRSVTRAVREILAFALGVEPHAVHPRADLFDDLGLDVSSGAIAMLALEEAFGIDLDEEMDGGRLRTLSDLVGAVVGALARAERLPGAEDPEPRSGGAQPRRLRETA